MLALRLQSVFSRLRAFSQLTPPGNNNNNKGYPSSPSTKISEVEVCEPTEVACNRQVIIRPPARSAMQAGLAKQGSWQLFFKREEMPKWENPMMGWTSSRDPYQALELSFASKEEAIAYAQAQGWQWECREGERANWGERTYAENFLYSPHPLRFIRTK